MKQNHRVFGFRIFSGKGGLSEAGSDLAAPLVAAVFAILGSAGASPAVVGALAGNILRFSRIRYRRFFAPISFQSFFIGSRSADVSPDGM